MNNIILRERNSKKEYQNDHNGSIITLTAEIQGLVTNQDQFTRLQGKI